MQIAECNAPVAKNIAGVIENKGLKQVYIAEKAGYSPQELNDMLNGRRLIKANDIARISLVLGVDVNCLYGNYICLFNYLFISSQMSAKPYFIGSTGILLLW